MRKSLIKIVSLLLIIGLNWTGLLAIGQTFAFFSNAEDSNDNTFTAATLDLSLRSGQNNFVPGADNMTPGKQVNRDIYVGKIAPSLPLRHKVSFGFISGNIELCNQLDLKIWYNHYFGPTSGGYANRDMRLKYDGPLTSLANLTDVDFIIPHPDDKFDTDPNDGTEQWFFYSIILPSAVVDSFQGEVCNFKFVFEAWQTNLPDSSGGFTDTEEIESTIKTGYWNPQVVLNEILPNAGNYPEFIELYNKTFSPIDLNGFYIKVSGNIIPINAITTKAYSGGSTEIPANGWLVVTTGGNILNDTSGTVTLYNQNDIEVDSYTYDASDYNINNTPGRTNDLVAYWPFDNDLGDKSGNGNNGTNYRATFASGKINQALSFNGTDNYASIANNDIFDFGSGEFSVESWIKTTSTLRQWVVTRYEYYGPGWGLGIQNGHALGYIRTAESGTGKKEIEGTVNVSDGDWHHIVMVRTGDKIKLYTDGAFEREGTLVGNVNNNEPIEVGRISFGGGSQYMSGLIDEVKIYNRALDATEVSEHYNDVGPSGTVPSDKSYARIPDGIGYWVDPIPTPGGPNILESEIINQEEPTEEEPIVEEELVAEEPPVEETPVTDEEQIVEEINEIIDEVIDTIVEEILPETEPTNEEASVEETPNTDESTVIEENQATEETVVEEQPATEEQPVVMPDNDSSAQDGAGESVSDGNSDAGVSSNGSSPAEGAGESSGNSSVDASGESVSE